MNITIIGHGNVGGALAGAFHRAGHTVTLGVRGTPNDEAQALLQQYTGMQALPLPQSAAGAEALLLATPPAAVLEVVPTLNLTPEVVVIDATNNLGAPLAGQYATAYAWLRAQGLPHVAKCFNTTGYENMAAPAYGPSLVADMFYGGSSPHARAVARQLALDAGFAQAYDWGGDEAAPVLEGLARAWIHMAIFQKHGRNMMFKVHWRG